MSDDLKPCPFCGNAIRNEVVQLSSGPSIVACSQCGAHGPPKWTEKEAIKSWNRRG